MPITLDSGKELVIELAAPEPAFALLDAVMADLKAVDLDLSSLDLKGLQAQDINVIKNLLCQFLGSKAIREAFFACAGKCLYDGKRITRETFAGADARADFLPVAQEVIKANLAPFFGSLVSKSSASKLPLLKILGSMFADSPAPDSSPSSSPEEK